MCVLDDLKHCHGWNRRRRWRRWISLCTISSWLTQQYATFLLLQTKQDITAETADVLPVANVAWNNTQDHTHSGHPMLLWMVWGWVQFFKWLCWFLKKTTLPMSQWNRCSNRSFFSCIATNIWIYRIIKKDSVHWLLTGFCDMDAAHNKGGRLTWFYRGRVYADEMTGEVLHMSPEREVCHFHLKVQFLHFS